MGELNVNPADLVKAAGDYVDLAARAAQLPPQAVAQIQAIAVSHGPMGYPTAVGLAMGLASREPAVRSQVRFVAYADRFTGHVATYTDTDRAAAADLDAIVFPQMHVDPKPPPTEPTRWVVCWLPSPDADPARYCPADTTRIEYVDSKGQWVQKDIGTGANEVILNDSDLPGVQYLPAPPTGPAPPGITDRLWPDEHGNLVHRHEGHAGEPPKIEVHPPGKISW